MSINEKDSGYKVIMHLRYSELTNKIYPPAFYLSRPKIRAIYNVTSCDEVIDCVQLPYFKEPKATSYPLDLNKGFDQFIFRRDAEPYQLLNKVQKFVLESEENVLKLNASQKTQTCASSSTSCPDKQSALEPKRKQILTTRGFLARIMLTPYRLKGSEYNSMTFYATRYCGILHLIDSNYKMDRLKKCSYHSKFVQACYSDSPDLEPNTNVPVDENNIIFSIYQTTLKEFDLIYSAEIQGIISDHKINDIHNLDEINECRFVLTKLLPEKPIEDIFDHPKCMLFWLQSYLTNVNDIFIGVRNLDGVVNTPVQMKRVQDMPKNRFWQPHICIRFLHIMLSLVEETMAKVDCPYTTYEFKYDCYAKCIKLKIHNGKSEYSLLSEEYIKKCKERTNFK
ncbi:decapping nuclease DXO homolog isoform X1 [Anastrepha obliqua]|uniref:decapping nuclease DXO homolog isoform X1 n=1 Tax=Anastrepha obliqua TaxID=95512 RepID=UPI0024099B76|nr:decapping nuclease DXO homolog isoform X1 [Anastrepha obliqua]